MERADDPQKVHWLLWVGETGPRRGVHQHNDVLLELVPHVDVETRGDPWHEYQRPRAGLQILELVACSRSPKEDESSKTETETSIA